MNRPNNINQLTAENVEKIFINCLATEPDISNITGYGAMAEYQFDKKELNESKKIIISFLKQLPDEFQLSKGGGWSFLIACIDKEGNQWGEHKHIEWLIALPNALDLIHFSLPKEMWVLLPGKMPYFVIHDEWNKKDNNR